jgi:poly-gamma-glutamate synthesis protein (capsule biosynthesis protein)
LVPEGAGEAARDEHTLVFVGDVMLSRGVGSLMKARNDWAYPFREVEETLRAADLAYCNLECPISDQGSDLHHLYSFRADPRALEGLKQAGFSVVSQANNHVYDWGPAAVRDSLERLHSAGIRTVGAGQNGLEAHYPTFVEVGGPPPVGSDSLPLAEQGSGPPFDRLTVRLRSPSLSKVEGRAVSKVERRGGLKVGFLAYVDIDPKEATAGVARPGVAWLEPERALADIRFARPLVDLLIVCPHWGVEYALRPTPEQVKLAHAMIDAGADLIVGSHPHVVQPLEQYRGRWVAYSLGNFVFDQKNPATHHGLLLKVTVRSKQIAEVIPVPIAINPQYQAVLAPPRAPVAPLHERRQMPAPALASVSADQRYSGRTTGSSRQQP